MVLWRLWLSPSVPSSSDHHSLRSFSKLFDHDDGDDFFGIPFFCRVIALLIVSSQTTSGQCSYPDPKSQLEHSSSWNGCSESVGHRLRPIHHNCRAQDQDRPCANSSIHHRSPVLNILGLRMLTRSSSSS